MWKEIWHFLRDDKNQKMLTMLGGGFAMAAAGLWAAFVHFHSAPEANPGPPLKQIEADCGSVAIAGDVSGATITAGTSAGCAKSRP
jgi:hypothetical protein